MQAGSIERPAANGHKRVSEAPKGPRPSRFFRVDYGTELPALALTKDVSAALMVPLALTSVRKLV